MLHWFPICLAILWSAQTAGMRGKVGPGRGKPILSARVVAELRFRYRRGRLGLAWVRVRRYGKERKLRIFRGRFRIAAYRRGRLLFRQGFDLPGLALTKAYTRRDRDLLFKMLAGVSSQGSVFVPWSPAPDRLEVWDALTRKRVVFRTFPRPGKRTAGSPRRPRSRSSGR